METGEMLDILESYKDRGLNDNSPPSSITTEAIFLSEGTALGSTAPLAYKFVLVANLNHYIMIFGLISEYPYHAHLVSAFCARRGIASHWIGQPDCKQIDDPQYRTLGGGYIDIDMSRKSARISGASKAYGFYDTEAVRWVAGAAPFFSGFSVSFEY